MDEGSNSSRLGAVCIMTVEHKANCAETRNASAGGVGAVLLLRIGSSSAKYLHFYTVELLNLCRSCWGMVG